MQHSRDELIRLIRDCFAGSQSDYLTRAEFRSSNDVTDYNLNLYFDTWAEACEAAEVPQSQTHRLKRRMAYSREECLDELRRIAAKTGKTTVSKSDLKEHGRFSERPFRRHFGPYNDALLQAGLQLSDAFQAPIPDRTIAESLVAVVSEVGKRPTYQQWNRRAPFQLEGQRRRVGTLGSLIRDYAKIALRLIAATDLEASAEAEAILRSLADAPGPEPAPHRQGRTLGFRGFAFAPTNESNVVALFGAVAHDLGFEIIATREPFPDCQARRRVDAVREHWVDCMIEFEFESRDFKRHGHDPNHCDLIVCWKHDWADCPLEVIELETSIKSLDGW